MLADLNEIKARRKAIGMSQQALAALAGISQSMLAKIEEGKEVPNYNIAKRLFEGLENIEHSKEGPAESIMHRRVVMLNSKDTVKRMASIAKRTGISQFPVMERGIIMGSISTKDIIGAEPGARISDLKKPSFPTVPKGTPISIVKELLSRSSAVLVMDGAKVIGIITPHDAI